MKLKFKDSFKYQSTFCKFKKMITKNIFIKKMIYIDIPPSPLLFFKIFFHIFKPKLKFI
jgi:hypothetical protein